MYFAGGDIGSAIDGKATLRREHQPSVSVVPAAVSQAFQERPFKHSKAGASAPAVAYKRSGIAPGRSLLHS